MHARLHERAPGLEHPGADLERLLLADRCRRRRRSRRGRPSGRPSLGLQHAARPRRRLLDHLRRRRVADHRRAELAGERGLRLEPGDDEHLDVGVQRPQDRGRAGAERAGAVHHAPCRPGGGGWRVIAWRRHRERVGEDGELVGHGVGDLEQHRVVRGHQLGVAAAGVASTCPVWMPGRDRPDAEVPAQAEIAGLARGHIGSTPRGPHDSHGLSTTRSPTSRPSASGPSATTSATTSWPSTWGSEKNAPHGVVGLSPLAPVDEDLLGVGPADAREPGLGDDPVGPQEARVVHVDEPHRRVPQRLEQRERGGIIVELGLGVGCDPEEQRLHRASSIS